MTKAEAYKLIRQTGGKLFKYSFTWEGRYYRFERKRDAIAFIDSILTR